MYVCVCDGLHHTNTQTHGEHDEFVTMGTGWNVCMFTIADVTPIAKTYCGTH